MKVLVLGTGSVSIKLFNKLLKSLESEKHEVRFILSEKAITILDECDYGIDDRGEDDYTRFIEFKKECSSYAKSNTVVHVELATWADVILVAPATANTIAKMHYGICDNVLMDTLLVASGLGRRILVAPAMNSNMWMAIQTQRNIIALKDLGIEVIYPTVKKLACGDYGIGGLADIKAIVDRVSGYRWKFPLDTYYGNRFIPTWPHPGAFGAVRKHEIHNGVDIYTDGMVDVFAVEDGELIETGNFTGKDVGSPWWEDTQYMIVEGHSGFIVYGKS